MPLDPSDRKRLEHMIRTAEDAIAIVADLDTDALARDMVRTRALVNCFTEIGEAAARLTPSGRASLRDLPFKQIVGMRNIVVHVYWSVDVGVLRKTTRDQLPRLIETLRAALASDSVDPSPS